MYSLYFAVPGRGGASAEHAPGPGGNGVADAGRKPLVDGSATGQAARFYRDQNQHGELADAWREMAARAVV